MYDPNIPAGYNSDGRRGNDFIEEEEELEPENECEDCGQYKNANRKKCDSCIYVNQ